MKDTREELAEWTIVYLIWFLFALVLALIPMG